MSAESHDDREPGADVVETLETATKDEIKLADELPVVARLVVEIRSDGKRTIARGAMEDLEAGNKVAIEARGDTPLQLAWALARSVFSMPSLARATARGLLKGRTKPPKKR